MDVDVGVMRMRAEKQRKGEKKGKELSDEGMNGIESD